MSEVDYRRVGGPPRQVRKPPLGSIYNHSFGELGIITSKLVSFLIYGNGKIEVYPLHVELRRVTFFVMEVPINTRFIDLVKLSLKVV